MDDKVGGGPRARGGRRREEEEEEEEKERLRTGPGEERNQNGVSEGMCKLGQTLLRLLLLLLPSLRPSLPVSPPPALLLFLSERQVMMYLRKKPWHH